MKIKKFCLSSFFPILIVLGFDICYSQEFHSAVSSPVYNGGIKALKEFMSQNIRYHKTDKNGSPGILILSYLISETGKVEKIKILRGINAECDSEAVRIAKLITGWKPASQWGKPVGVRVVMPIEFYLGNDKIEKGPIMVTGNVSSKATNEPVEGCLILAQGTNIGAKTDEYGNYSITVPGEEFELEFSSLGYGFKSEKIGKNRTINVELLPEDLVIDFSSK